MSFGSTQIKIPNITLELNVNANFSRVLLSGSTKITTGTCLLQPAHNNQLPVLQLSIDAFCGKVIITNQQKYFQMLRKFKTEYKF